MPRALALSLFLALAACSGPESPAALPSMWDNAPSATIEPTSCVDAAGGDPMPDRAIARVADGTLTVTFTHAFGDGEQMCGLYVIEDIVVSVLVQPCSPDASVATQCPTTITATVPVTITQPQVRVFFRTDPAGDQATLTQLNQVLFLTH